MCMSGAEVIRRVVNYCPQPKQEHVRAILADEELLLAIWLTVQDAETASAFEAAKAERERLLAVAPA